MTDRLAVWLDGIIVAEISRDRGRMRLRYTEEAIERYPLGYPLLSMSLTLSRSHFSHGLVRAFLDGLLPEGDARQTIARDFGVAWDDSYGLIEALGRDCAGGIVIQPIEDAAPVAPTTLRAKPLADAEVAGLIQNLRAAPLGAGGAVRISLGGVQEKLLLTRLPDGQWGQPIDGTPSTHILKPGIAGYPNTVENEAFSMRVAKELGLPAASVELLNIGGRKLLVVERFDRIVHQTGTVRRLHQEDFCQALALLPSQKYEENGGPSLRRVAEILQAVSSPESVESLLRAVTLNMILGNCDAHAKNFSLLHGDSGDIGLAPLYDLMCTAYYGEDRLAMYIDTIQRLSRVTGDRVLREAVSWGLSPARAHEILIDVVERAPGAMAAAAAATPELPTQILRILEAQILKLREGLGA